MIELAPSLEMDKLIGRQVFGWREWSQAARKTNPYDRSKWWAIDGSGPVYLNRYSTDIKAAWDLVEKFRLVVGPFGETGWTAAKKWCDDEMVMLQNMAPTAPHAICLAVLFYANEDGE